MRENYYELADETAVPGYYSAVFNDVRCQLTVNSTTVYHWKNAYGVDGLMSEDSPYYEGDRYTYSFRRSLL